MKKLIDTQTLTSIADAIRNKEKTSELIPTIEMANRIANLPSGGEPWELRRIHKSPYVDENNKFNKPDDWDDIESLTLGDQEVYWLYAVKDVDLSWASFNISVSGTGNYVLEFGRVVNGQFVSFGSQYNLTNAYTIDLKATFPDKDYVVIHLYVTGTTKKITGLQFRSVGVNGGPTRDLAAQPCLMRYGSLIYATQVPLGGNRYIVSDRMKNLQALTTCASLYANCQNLVRIVRENWNTTNVTSFANMFQYCYRLVDIDMDLTGLVKSKCTTLSSMFHNMYSYQGEINVSDWDTSNVTSIYYTFYCCYNVTKIIGIESWKLRKVNYVNATFINCYSLKGELDLSGWELCADTTSFNTSTTLASMFAYCYNLTKVNMSGWQVKSCASMATMLQYCYLLEEVILPELETYSKYPTGLNSMFAYCVNLKKVSGNIPLNGATSIASLFQEADSLVDISGLTFSGTLLGSNANNTCTNVFTYVLLETLDLSWLDVSKWTYAGSATASAFSTVINTCFYLKEIYPPVNINGALNISSCYRLSHDSLIRIFNNLATLSSAKTITIGNTLKSLLTNDEIAIATGKGWTVA